VEPGSDDPDIARTWWTSPTTRALFDIGRHTHIQAVEPVVRLVIGLYLMMSTLPSEELSGFTSSLSWLKTCVPVGPLYKVEGKACNSRNKRAGSSVHSEGKVWRVGDEPCRPSLPY